MIIPIDPVLLTIGPLAVRWFGLLALAGLGLAAWRTLVELDRQRLPRRVALDAFAWALPGGLVVARMVHVLAWWDYYVSHAAEIWTMGIDGLSLWGGLLGGGAFALARLASTRDQDPIRARRILDVLAPNVALGIAVGRVGELLDGHGQGIPSSVAWATQYASRLAATPDFGVARHPAQAYDGLAALGVWLVASHLPRRAPPGGRLSASLVLYGAARVVLGGVRLDPTFLFGLQLEQLLALAAIAFGLAYALQPIVAWRGLAGASVHAPRVSAGAAGAAGAAEDSLAA